MLLWRACAVVLLSPLYQASSREVAVSESVPYSHILEADTHSGLYPLRNR